MGVSKMSLIWSGTSSRFAWIFIAPLVLGIGTGPIESAGAAAAALPANPARLRSSLTVTANVHGVASVAFKDRSGAPGWARLPGAGIAGLPVFDPALLKDAISTADKKKSPPAAATSPIIAAIDETRPAADTELSSRDEEIEPRSSIPKNVRSGLILALAIAVAAVLILLRRFIFVVIVRLFRAPAKVVRTLSRLMARILRFLRLASRSPTKQKTTESLLGLSINAVASSLTETDEAIAEGFELKTIRLEKNKRIFCTWLEPVRTEQDQNQSPQYTKEQAQIDFKNSEYLFKTNVPISSNPLNLYDDISNAFIVNTLKGSDKECFYVLSEFRKVVNNNVMVLTIVFSMLVSLVMISNIFFSTSIDFYSMFNLQEMPFTIPEWLGGSSGKSFINKFFFGMFSCLCGYALMWLFYGISYDQCQRFNGRNLEIFLIGYLTPINAKFIRALNSASRSVVVDQDAQTIRQDTVLWITNLQWMAFRVFLIEQFLRSILFQIRRNSIYTSFLIPTFFVILILGAAYVFNLRGVNVFSLGSSLYHQNSFYVCFAVLLIAYFIFLRGSLSKFAESLKGGWPKFARLNIVDALSTIMESYAIQLNEFRSRFRDRPEGH
jgi:hypothetical protein